MAPGLAGGCGTGGGPVKAPWLLARCWRRTAAAPPGADWESRRGDSGVDNVAAARRGFRVVGLATILARPGMPRDGSRAPCPTAAPECPDPGDRQPCASGLRKERAGLDLPIRARPAAGQWPVGRDASNGSGVPADCADRRGARRAETARCEGAVIAWPWRTEQRRAGPLWVPACHARSEATAGRGSLTVWPGPRAACPEVEALDC